MKNIIQQLKTKLTALIAPVKKDPGKDAQLKKLKHHITHSLNSLDELDKILDSLKTGKQV